MSAWLWLLIIPGVLWWALTLLCAVGWWPAARERKQRRAAVAKAMLTPDCPSLPDSDAKVYRAFADIVVAENLAGARRLSDHIAELYGIPDKEH